MNRPGDRVGTFELVELIAVRPLADLWKAERVDRSSKDPRTAVVRVAHNASDPESLTDLRREYDALRSIDDPRVRKAYGFYAGHGALALEFVDGISLKYILEQRAAGGVVPELGTLVDILVELAGALRVVHDAGVTHGRLCADTVRLRIDGGVVLTDFALPDARMPVHPPELRQGFALSPATDQWLLGALAIQMITGEALLGGRPGEPADGRRDTRPHIQPLQAIAPALARAVTKMLARDPRDRYTSDSTLIRDLLAILRGVDTPPARDALVRRVMAAAGKPVAPVPMQDPTPRLGPAPEMRPVTLRPPPVAEQDEEPTHHAGSLGERADRPAPTPAAAPAAPRSLVAARPPGPPEAAPRRAATAAVATDLRTSHAAPTRPVPLHRATSLDELPPPPDWLRANTGDPEEPASPPAAKVDEAPAAPLVAVAPAPESPQEFSEPQPVVARAAPGATLSPTTRVPAPSRPPTPYTPQASDLARADEFEDDAPPTLSPSAHAAPRMPDELMPPPGRDDDRLIPDWLAAMMLVLLLAVGVWAILSRIL